MTIRVERFSGAAGVRALAPAWQTLTARILHKRHFHHVEWYLALAETFEQHNLPPLHCIAVFSAEALVAVFPYRQDRLQLGRHSLRLMKLVSDQGEGETARDFVMAPALTQGNFFQGLVKYLAEHDQSWDIISLHGILEDSFAATALQHSPQLPFSRHPAARWIVAGSTSFPAATATDHSNVCRRASKRICATAHNRTKSKNVTFAVARTEEDLQRFLPEFLKVESSGWKGELGTSALKDAATNTFIQQLIAQFGPKRECELHLMRIGDEAVAALFGIVTDDVWYMFRIGYDETFDRASPGHLIIENLLNGRSTHPSFSVITPYNAPVWFEAWKSDRILNIYNSYVFRPSPEGIKLARQIEEFVRGLNVPITVPVKSE